MITEDINKKLDSLLNISDNQRLDIVELQCHYEALLEIILDHLSGGDDEKRNYLALGIEKKQNEIFQRRFPNK